MANFSYQGRSNQGQAVNGQMEAVSKDIVASQLMARGITPVKIDEVTLGASITQKIEKALGKDKITTVELIMFCRQMYTITKAGIPLTRGLRGLSASIRHLGFQSVLINLADRLETGANLSQSMSHHPKIFNRLFVSMVSVGESTGQLEEIFRQLVFYLERDEETKKRVKSALRYPSFVIIALIIALATVNIFVIPEFAKMFAKFNAELPLVTRILIGTSDLFVNYWYLLLLGAIGLVGGFIYYIKTEQGELFWGQKKMKLPVVGGLIERASMARYSRSFGLMLRAGVPLNQALTLCAAAIDNPYLARKIINIRQGIERGDSLLRTHVASEMFTPLVIQMIAVGEESGQVEELLSEVAEFYEREVDYDLKTLTDRIEPILIVIMAVFVAVLALGIFLPMWSMYEVQAR
ncbi:type II secretion system F family protein [Teredinibacter sp. KSP-S5-2]|uniref:type II secretion system F family protein n=1 Tax=Teredinibacter sp. KSP-S5-2 TaxID=3034506 RepID=UPI0029348EFF|nr:type II secretion system F family protein [Teredinibacter sp. KSP-S5-2]WNO09905.1 type II secretion system F family protein [Teredinibacter sp. KSP-S5-2]